MRRPLLPLLLAAAFSAPVRAERSLDLNLGLSHTKSILGASYTWDRNQINAGLKGFWFESSQGFDLYPGITYNRYLTSNGWYAGLTYTPRYTDREHTAWRSTGPNSWVPVTVKDRGWEAGNMLVGLGKSFRFQRWGIHLDGGIGSPLDEFGTTFGYTLGLGISYRFLLD